MLQSRINFDNLVPGDLLYVAAFRILPEPLLIGRGKFRFSHLA